MNLFKESVILVGCIYESYVDWMERVGWDGYLEKNIARVRNCPDITHLIVLKKIKK